MSFGFYLINKLYFVNIALGVNLMIGHIFWLAIFVHLDMRRPLRASCVQATGTTRRRWRLGNWILRLFTWTCVVPHGPPVSRLLARHGAVGAWGIGFYAWKAGSCQ